MFWPVKSSGNFVERHEHQATVLPSVLYWEIYPCVWVCLFIRIFISHLHEKHSRTRLQNLTIVFLYLYHFKNALSSSDISARYFVVKKTLSPSIIQLFRERLSEKLCMRQSRKVIWDIINTPFLALWLSNLLLLLSFNSHKHTSMACRATLFFKIFLKSSELSTTHNTFRGCRVHFSRQPFSK